MACAVCRVVRVYVILVFGLGWWPSFLIVAIPQVMTLLCRIYVCVLCLQAFNALVDQCAIEKICLFASKEEAEKACLRGPSGKYKVITKNIILRMY